MKTHYAITQIQIQIQIHLQIQIHTLDCIVRIKFLGTCILFLGVFFFSCQASAALFYFICNSIYFLLYFFLFLLARREVFWRVPLEQRANTNTTHTQAHPPTHICSCHKGKVVLHLWHFWINFCTFLFHVFFCFFVVWLCECWHICLLPRPAYFPVLFNSPLRFYNPFRLLTTPTTPTIPPRRIFHRNFPPLPSKDPHFVAIPLADFTFFYFCYVHKAAKANNVLNLAAQKDMHIRV